MTIPLEHRTKHKFLVDCNTYADLKDNVVSFTEQQQVLGTPLRWLSARFFRSASKLRRPLNEVLAELESEGRIAVQRIEALNRTFVFPAANWNAMQEDFASGESNWLLVEQALRDVK